MLKVTGIPGIPQGAWTPCMADPTLFTADRGQSAAKRACRHCCFRVDCFIFAADPDNQITYGVWGGFSFDKHSPDADFINLYRRKVWGPLSTQGETA